MQTRYTAIVHRSLCQKKCGYGVILYISKYSLVFISKYGENSPCNFIMIILCEGLFSSISLSFSFRTFQFAITWACNIAIFIYKHITKMAVNAPLAMALAVTV